MIANFSHPALALTTNKPLIYTAFSKHLFYYRMFISKYVLEKGAVPLNPFMVFDYFLLDAVDRDLVREANNNLVKRCDELWVFGPISNGVLAEIKIAEGSKKPIRYFKIDASQVIRAVMQENAEFEEGVAMYKNS